MYKNIYYDHVTNIIHLWDDKKGYNKFQHKPYCYVKANEETGIKSIFGDNVKRFNDDPSVLNTEFVDVYESDVYDEIRFLVDHYYNKDEIPKNIKILAFDIEVARSETLGYADPTPEESFNEVLSISLLTQDREKTVLLLDKDDRYQNLNNYDFVHTFHTESQLLSAFLIYLDRIKPDIITGWNSQLYDIPYLYNRMGKILGDGIQNNLSPIGKCYYKQRRDIVDIGGISHLDYMQLYKNYTFDNKPSYSLDEIAKDELNEGKVEYDGDLQKLYETNIDKFVEYNIQDTDLIFKLDDKLGFIDQNITIAVNSCVPFEYALHSTLYQEGRFLTETKKRNLVVPNKPDVEKDLPLIGAFVKESKAGLFDWVYDQDLASLYPFIIVTLNLSPETKVGQIRNYIDVWHPNNEPVQYKINHPIFDASKKAPNPDKKLNIIVDMKDGNSYRIKTMGDLYKFMNQKNLTLSANGIFFSKEKMGIIPEIMLKTYEERMEFKQKRNEALDRGDKDEAEYYNRKQMAWKILLNSFYGVMGNPSFRFFDRDLAQSITLTGQYVTKSGMDEVKRIHKKMYDDLSDQAKEEMSDQMRRLFKDPHLTGDTDSVILTAMPILYAKFGNEWKNKDEDELIEFVSTASHKIAKIINARMEEFSSNWLNADENYLKFKEEWVAKRGFYLGVKKRYANWIIWEEGHTIPEEEREAKVKGLDIIRSDFPRHLQDFMREILNRLLQEGEEVKDEVLDYIVDFKTELKSVDVDNILSIAKIVSANNLKKYTDPKDPSRYLKNCPYHIIGAIYYNTFLRVNDLNNEYQEISEGDKIAFVYLRSNEYSFDRIAFPIDYRTPPEFIEFLEKNTHKIKSVKKLLDNKLQKYYDALGWKKPNEKYNEIDDLFV